MVLLFWVEAFWRQAAKVPCCGRSDEDFQRMIQEISSVDTRGRVMMDALRRFTTPRAISASQTPLLERGSGGARGARDAREPSPTPSTASSIAASSVTGGSVSKRPRPSADAATVTASGAPLIGDDSHLALLGQGIADAAASRPSIATAFANDAEIEKEYFSPLSVETDATRWKICAAVSRRSAPPWWTCRRTRSSMPPPGIRRRHSPRRG